ncbi:hypothetical protein VKT23_017711 [Stygiomarasmius scandens]|uniref:Uncharacterized protein n=1 Tax=Marasmiellus scandens TaxID=2682957 RepID=A0ABR1IRB7_9AGAR
MACALILMFIGSTACYASGMIWNNIQIWQMAYPELDPFKTLYNMNIINIVFPRMTYILGDMIVVWRAWILYDSKPLIRIFLAFCITTVLVVSVVDSVLTTVNVDAVLADVPLIFGLMLPVTLLFTNLSATLLIGYKVWHYRKFVKIHLGNFSPSTQVERILIILVESGAFYCCLWVLVILTKNLSSANIQIHAYLGILMPHMASIYPTLIILTTMRQNSHGDSTLHDVLSGPIIFASGNESVSATPNTPGLTSTKSKQEVYMTDAERGSKLNPEAEPQVPIAAQGMNSGNQLIEWDHLRV